LFDQLAFKAVALPLAHGAKPRLLIDVACGAQDVIRPQRDRRVARLRCKVDALINSDPKPACGWLDEQQTKFGALSSRR
jgi:hypothetical protein